MREISGRQPVHGLTMRLALSCLVDADHSDSARFDGDDRHVAAPEPRWNERLRHLTRYVNSLPEGRSDAEQRRNSQRRAFFEECVSSRIDGPLVACEAPVGSGKTTAIVAYLLRRAREEERMRRVIVIAPYTPLLPQTAERLRLALTLPHEDPQTVVVEHHHRADFESREARDLAIHWRAPVVLTTAVSFFETLAANRPGTLRKLHAVPGSAIYIDEAHAAMPTALWPQNWKWLVELTRNWGCRIVFASGSLSRFWESNDIVNPAAQLPSLLPGNQAREFFQTEQQRVRYQMLNSGHVIDIGELIEQVKQAEGPRLVILNTVQNAAVVARALRKSGFDVLHLSTALTPTDRDCVVRRIRNRLWRKERDWTLVATSCVESGVDFSFRTAFRERFSVASTIQTGGRVNRHNEHAAHGGSSVYDFALDDELITRHPAATRSAGILLEVLRSNALNRHMPSDVVTDAMKQEIAESGGMATNRLLTSEGAYDYPAVQTHGRVIEADQRLVVVDENLKARLSKLSGHLAVSSRELLAGSVQIWARKIEQLPIEPLAGRRELYAWTDDYDSEFLGYMAGVLRTTEWTTQFLASGGAVI
ncbi:MAG: DEAD/DEAH box helicase [Gemmatimonadaceae bacterium]